MSFDTSDRDANLAPPAGTWQPTPTNEIGLPSPLTRSMNRAEIRRHPDFHASPVRRARMKGGRNAREALGRAAASASGAVRVA